jgi:hypothetical protein
LGIDYGYLTGRTDTTEETEQSEDKDGNGEKCSPIMCGRFSSDRWIFGHFVPSKGIEHPYNAEILATEIRRCGVKKLFIRSDREPAILALIRKAAQMVMTDGIAAVPDPARIGDKNANGIAEGAVKEVKAKIRVGKYAVENLLGVTLTPTHQCLPFLAESACVSLNRGRRGPEGRTAYELRRGGGFH